MLDVTGSPPRPPWLRALSRLDEPWLRQGLHNGHAGAVKIVLWARGFRPDEAFRQRIADCPNTTELERRLVRALVVEEAEEIFSAPIECPELLSTLSEHDADYWPPSLIRYAEASAENDADEDVEPTFEDFHSHGMAKALYLVTRFRAWVVDDGARARIEAGYRGGGLGRWLVRAVREGSVEEMLAEPEG
ncbi:hypothetical protein [Stackebrandtia soli]|uniref:hypothetical protein n=1 Tax=Stackebrandtia soli TaxID=1892856 RepID=UPI0039E9C279